MEHFGAIRKQRTMKSRRESSRRCPNMKEIPMWLRMPLQRLVRSRPPMTQQWDRRRRPVLDWDAWVRQHLTRDYWQMNGAAAGSWLVCVREWAATHSKDNSSLLSTPDALIRAIVTVTVAETLAHQHGTQYSKLDLQTRRHINTTASRQRTNAISKVSLYHVAQLVLARFDYDLFLQKLSCSPEHVRMLKSQMEYAFDELHRTAASEAESYVLRTTVVGLIQALHTSVRGFLFLPWHSTMHLQLPGCTLLLSAVRSFLNSLPTPDVSFLSETPLDPYNLQFTFWLRHLGSPVHDSRWKALTMFTRIYCSSSPLLLGEDPCAKISFVIMTVLLFAASGQDESILRSIMAVATAHTYCMHLSQRPIVFRDMLDVKLGIGGRLAYPCDATNVGLQHSVE